MESWNAGYVTAVDYTHGFYKELTPNLLSFFTLLQGYDAPGSDLEPRNYCELGCGQGFTTNVLAASNPHIQFYATDFNPRHISGARELARAAKLTNVHFSDDSFGDYLERSDLPDFDFIALHGIYSWVPAQVRQDIVRFIRKKLKPGGIVYISYNAMPGWAALQPLGRLLMEHANSQGANRPLLPRVGTAIEFVESLQKAEADYFTRNPLLEGYVSRMKGKHINYIAHEYFNREMTPFYFMDLARELSEAKLSWVGQAHGTAGIDHLHLTPEQRDLLATIEDASFRETIRDHILNQQFRRDVFIKGPIKLSEKASRDKWLGRRFVLRGSKNLSPKMDGRRYGAEMNPALFNSVVAAFADGPRTLGEIVGLPELSTFKLESITRMLSFFVDQNAAFPCLPSDGQAERILRANIFNRAVTERIREGQDLSAFACGVTGGGLPHDKISQLVWLAMHDKEQDLEQAVLRDMERLRIRVTRNDTSLDLRTALGGIISNLEEKEVTSFWRAMGLLEASKAAPKAEHGRLSA
ncbi:class I SAM-dependent methyltransferase [Microvirga sp. ACRRW]|uniref:class I SAM-dependent methyltransferase n=1 Tax=Microvirga sp. ACRRW TaxID=2918205 RepID=UPI001EF472FE|nr:class I SAM-dependent methyltransferase [Microvirga sp. ACRRW]MCG7391853.1 class I SAM-dependent methyltransferase [Microvirga sp. ACRRW]